MPYKNPEEAKERKRLYYQLNKDKWKAPDGSWKVANITPERRSEIGKKSYAKHKEKYRPRRQANQRKAALQYLYNLSIEDYNDKVEEQQSLCLICAKPVRKLYVDHCHTTNKIRGLLCGQCNVMLGMAKDNTEILNAAIRYLEKYS